jgi:hypothetical protein
MSFKKNLKILQIFSNGSLNFVYSSFRPQKNSQIFFYEKDIKNFYIYNKNKHHRLNINDIENLTYRKKYFDSKDSQ